MKSHDKGNAKESKPAIPAPTNKSQPEKPVGILAFFLSASYISISRRSRKIKCMSIKEVNENMNSDRLVCLVSVWEQLI